jgi:indole-3-glycerol phosphate synthase
MVLKTFHVLGGDVPDDFGRVPPKVWKRAVGLNGFMEEDSATDQTDKAGVPAFFLIPSPAFQNDLNDLLSGISYNFPGATTFGGIASTVSSLSRARLFRYDANDPQGISTLADGCVGVAMVGDIELKTMVAQGTKPVGGIYRIVTGNECTIKAIMLDEAATEEANAALEGLEEAEQEDDGKEGAQDKNAIAAAAYAKAAIPKPPLAEANFVMRALSDDDQSSMRKAILIGLERGGSMGRTPNELARLAEGKGHRFTVFQVAAAGMKDGSVTLPLGRVNVQPGTRVRFFVRESEFAKKEVQAIWTGYKKRSLEETLMRTGADAVGSFEPAMCLFMSTLDRGNKFFKGKSAYETNAISQFVPSLPCMGGFFTNGVIGKLDETEIGDMDVMVHGSASIYVLIGSASRRPIYSAAAAAAAASLRLEAVNEASDLAESNMELASITSTFTKDGQSERAPRAPNGELRLKRREVHAGRALTVSTVEWSVADNAATPTSTLEGFMWDKETEVDRFRERVPLSNLVSQCRLSQADPTVPKPRDWVGPILRRTQKGEFAIIPECKRIEPASGSLRKRYDVPKLANQFVKAGVSAMAVNCDPVLFGGSLEDLTSAREASSFAAAELATEDGVEVPPILASDLILYPYQLYKLRLAGADAVNLIGGALATKDLLYLTKIAASLQIQCLVTCTSEVQIEALLKLSKGSIHGLILSNRDLEDFSFDMTGRQALGLLKSDALARLREHHGENLLILVEGRVGLIEGINAKGDPDIKAYLQELEGAGAVGAIIGGALAKSENSEMLAALR